METWAVVTIALGASIVTALSTLAGVTIQARQADKRFEKDLKRAREVDYRERRREVRSQPLLRLRAELADMATKLGNLVSAAERQHTRMGATEKQTEEELKQSVDEWNDYLRSGNWARTIFSLDDIELQDAVREVQTDYLHSFYVHQSWKDVDATEMQKAMKVFERNRHRITEIQALINKRLDEL
jgi:hypothetical protein